MYYLHKSLKAANSITAFKYRIEGDKVYEYDVINASPTINRSNGTFGFSYLDYHEDFNSMRKPGIGMFLKAKEELGIDLKNSLMIGDSIVDIQAAERAEMKSIFLLSGQGESYLEDIKRDYKPNLIANNLLHAAKEITSI